MLRILITFIFAGEKFSVEIFCRFLFFQSYLVLKTNSVTQANPFADYGEMYDYSQYYSDNMPMDLYHQDSPKKLIAIWNKLQPKISI